MDAMDLTALTCGDFATTPHGRQLRAVTTLADAEHAADEAEYAAGIAVDDAYNDYVDDLRAETVTQFAAAYTAGDTARQEDLLLDAAFIDAANPGTLPLVEELHAVRYGQAA